MNKSTITNPALDTDFEVNNFNAMDTNETAQRETAGTYIKYLIAGIVFGIVLVKSEVISWFRIQEMFRLQSFHMYGVIGSAIVTGAISIQLIKRFNVKTMAGETIHLPQKKFNKGQIFGGLIFGFGWALTGACPGPLYALIGSGTLVFLIPLLSAIAGTWVYGLLRDKLPQ